MLVCTQEIEELTAYVKEITYDPAIIKGRIQKIMLLHIAALRFIILAFENEDEFGYALLENCEKMSKTLYLFYKDVNILLISREMKHIWKNYMKLEDLAPRVPEESTRKVDSSKDRILSRLRAVELRIKSL